MGRTLEAKAGITPMWRAKGDAAEGQIVSESDDGRYILVEPEPNEYHRFENNAKCEWELSGISEAFEMTGQYGTSTNVRVEFRCMRTKNAQYAAGKRWTGLYTYKIGPKSNLGALLGRLRGRDIEAGENIDIDAHITTRFIAPVVVNNNGYNELIPLNIEEGSITRSTFLNGDAPEPALVGATGRDDGEDPFEGNEDEL